MGQRRAKPTRSSPHDLFVKYGPALAYVAVRDVDGHESIGAAFHVGEGVFLTARHVVESKTIVEVKTTQGGYVRLSGREAKEARTFLHLSKKRLPVHSLRPEVLQIEQGPFYHSDPTADVAVFRVRKIDPYTPAIELGGHFDDWIGQTDFMLWQVIVLGYPPIPLTREPHLVAARAEVNAVVDVGHARHPHFIVSSLPRGGFSGGPVLTDDGWAFGLVTQSLLRDHAAAELGFMAVLSIEPIYACLEEHRLLPQRQVEPFPGMFNVDSILPSSPP